MGKKFECRPYQRVVVDKVLSIYNKFPKDRRAFLDMPTGTGKTWTALAVVMELYEKMKAEVVWTAHQNTLVEQSFDDLMEFLGLEIRAKNLSDLVYVHNNITFRFMTWQSFRNSTKKVDMLIIDECHYGSSVKEADDIRDHKSFKTILKLADTHLYVSATPWSLNKDLFKDMFNDNGRVKKERRATYTMRQAKDDGFICNVIFNVIQSVDTLEIKRQQQTLTNQSDDLEENAEFVARHDVDIKHSQSLKNLRQSMLYSILDVYFQKEGKGGSLPPTIIFCKTNADADKTLSLKNVVKTIKKKAREHFGPTFPVGSKFVDYVHSKDRSSGEKIQKFRAGRINILCVVGMAKEGFNYRELQVAIDLSPSFSNTRQMVQKIGRVVRQKADKNMNARYYYADTLDNYIRVNGVRKVAGPNLKNDLKVKIAETMKVSIDEVTDEQVDLVVDNALKVAQLDEEMSDGQDRDSEKFLGGINEFTSTNNKKKKTVTVAEIGFIVTSADNKNPMKKIKNFTLFDGLEIQPGTLDPCGSKLKIRKLFESETRLPSSVANDPEERRLANRMYSYVRKSSESYDPEFAHWARGNGYGRDTASERREEIKNFFKINGRFPAKSEGTLYNSLKSYCYEKSETYNREFHEWALANGYKKDTAPQNKEEIIHFFSKNGFFPRHQHEPRLRNLLTNYTCTKSNSYDPEFARWARDNGHGEDRTVIRKQMIKDRVEKGLGFPDIRSEDIEERRLAQNLQAYCSVKKEQFDKKFNDWARKNGYGQETKNKRKELLDFIRKHKRKPNSRRGKYEARLKSRLYDYLDENRPTYDVKLKLEIVKLLTKCGHENV